MPRGGKREGAGRPPGARNKLNREAAEQHAKEGVTPLQFFLGIMRNPEQKHERRFAAACEAAPLMHGRIANVSPERTPDVADKSEEAVGDNIYPFRDYGPRWPPTNGSGA